MKRVLVLDIDNTLTPPRRSLEPQMAAILNELTVPFLLDAGSDLPLVTRQFLRPLHEFGFRGEVDAFLCNGAKRYRCSFGEQLSVRVLRDFDLREHVGAEYFERLVRLLRGLLVDDEFCLAPPLTVIGEQIVERGAMVNFAPIGRPSGELTDAAYTNRDAFVAFDERTGYRLRLMNRLEREIKGLGEDRGLRVMLGGQTSFDICVEGNDKSYPLRVLLEEGAMELIYIGDALFEGGNDGAVLEFVRNWPTGSHCPVKTVRVKSWRETPARLRELGVVGDSDILSRSPG